MSASIYASPVNATVQFGNPGDTSGYQIVQAEVIGERKGMCGRVYLVRNGDKFGAATFDASRGLYYCTNAMELGGYFSGHRFTAKDLARHFSFPEEVFA